MRICNLTVSGFRGFASRYSFDLNGTAVILSGVNGQGKTSLFDAILWSLSGKVPRIGLNDSRLLSLYSTSGEMSVSLDLASGSGEPLRVTRSWDGQDQVLTLERSDTVTRGSEAQVQLLRLLWPPALVTQKENDALCSAITRGVYLQQDVVRQFIEADDDQQRFNAISELVGIGRATDLQLSLERAKKNWTRATNQRIKDNEDVFARLDQVRAQLD
jgi:DNA repair exonuclease SbcCD ATPase subunit